MNYKNLLFFNKSGHQYTLKWNGSFWEGRLLFPEVSVGLFEIEHFFIVEKFKKNNGEILYGYPHISPDITQESSALSLYGEFVSGSNIVYLNSIPVPEYVGAKIFTPQFSNGNRIVSIDSARKTLTLENNSLLDEENVPIFMNLWISSFETTRNVLDFDAFEDIIGSVEEGKDYIITNYDTSLIKDSDYNLLVLGDGIPKDARIVKIEDKKIFLNKNCTATLVNYPIFIYPVEERNDVSDYIYQYSLTSDSNLDSPILNVLDKNYFKIDYDPLETITNDQRITDLIESSSLPLNVALNSSEEGIFGRTLVIEDFSMGYPKLVARIEIHGETVSEDERYKVLLSNFGRSLHNEDAYIIRDSDPKEPLPDFEIINEKRKELLLQGHEIFPYMGSYRGLINAIRFFGYWDLRIKEYWLNIKKVNKKSPLQENTDFLTRIKKQDNSQSTLVADLIDNENSGKYKQVEVYGKKDDGTYGIKSQLEDLFPSSSFKKTSLFGLFYDINKVVDGEFDEFGYPVVENAFMFSPEEVLIKLFGLKEKLKKDYLPLNARIVDITGEGVYFTLYKNRNWIDSLKIDQLNNGLDIDIAATPDFGYIEDLRHFYLRNNQSIPTVPYVGKNPFDYNFTTYGNITEPTTNNPVLNPLQSRLLIDAINNFYNERNNDGVPKYLLGDGDSKMGGYFKMSDGYRYEPPCGFPTVIEATSFNLSWDELGNKWENLDRNIATYSTVLASVSDLIGYNDEDIITESLSYSFDLSSNFLELFNISLPIGLTYLNPSLGKLQFKFTSNDDNSCFFVAELQSYNIVTGSSNLKLLWTKGVGIFSDWKIEIVNLFQSNLSIEYYNYSFNPDGFYSWNNLRFAGFYEIEWSIIKEDIDKPYRYEFRGKLKDYYAVPVILPYDGIYSVKCRVWGGFNDICTAYYERLIEVKTRELEITNVARYREAEVYTWENTTRPWDDYPSMWVFPVENKSLEFFPKPTDLVTNLAEYGNQYNEGQECKVLKTFPEVLGSAFANFGLKKMQITGFTSNYPGGGIGKVIVTLDPTELPHDFNEDSTIYLLDTFNTSNNISGFYPINSVTSNTFKLPFKINYTADPSRFFIIKQSTITVKYEGREIVSVDFNGVLSGTLGDLMNKLNRSKKIPAFKIDTIVESDITSPEIQEWMKVEFKPPIGSGKDFDGKFLEITTEGSLYSYNSGEVQYLQSVISGGKSEYKDYVDYAFGGDLPVENIRFYGTKALNWDSFYLLDWDNLYAQTWGMYDYHNEWHGGFSIYNLQLGDRIRVGGDTEGIIIGDLNSPSQSLGYLDLKEACDQLNASKDPGISKFTYGVRGFSRLPNKFDEDGDYEASPLTTLAIPYNEETETIDLQSGSSPGTESPTSISISKFGEIIMGGKRSVKIFGSPSNIDVYPIYDEYQNCSTRKVYVDEYDRFWCYGEMCETPLVIYDKEDPSLTRIFTTTEANWFNNPQFNLIVPIPAEKFQVICLGVDNVTDNFVMYVKYQQSYSSTSPALNDTIFALIEFNSSTQEFSYLSSRGPQWSVLKTYDEGSIVTRGSVPYISIEDSNTSSDPEALEKWKILEYDPKVFIDTSLYSIRQLKYEAIGKKSKLWIASNDGIKIYDGIKISTLNENNSGLHSNDIYSISFDERENKWVGTTNGICYFDGQRWGNWTTTSRPELPTGRYRNIVNLKNGKIFFLIQRGDNNYKLVYFNGLNFIVYSDDPGSLTPFGPIGYFDFDYEDLYMIYNHHKSIYDDFSKYPGDLFYISEDFRSGSVYSDPTQWDFTKIGVFNNPTDTDLKRINYFIPSIHALAKYPGMEGWEFVYHSSFNSITDPEDISFDGIGTSIINFNFIIGPLFSSAVTPGKYPQLPYVDNKSWKKPDWIDYDFDKVLDSHPEIDPEDLFLDAPLRDLLDGSATKEQYWKNSNVTRSSDREKENILEDYEWVIRIGDNFKDKGIKIFVGPDGFIYATGYFSKIIYFGAKNSLPNAFTTLASFNNQSIFVVKYNTYGVVQWARMYGEDLADSPTWNYDYTPTSIRVDNLGNIVVVGYKEKNRNNTTNENPSNFYVRWDWNANLVSKETLFNVPETTYPNIIRDVEIDVLGNTYVTGVFQGTLSTGEIAINSESPNNFDVFVAKIESDGYVKWLKKPRGGGIIKGNPSLKAGYSPDELYLAYAVAGETEQAVYLNRYSGHDFSETWVKELKNQTIGYEEILKFAEAVGLTGGISIDPTDRFLVENFLAEPHIKVSRNQEIALGVTYSGTLVINDISLQNVLTETSITDTNMALIKLEGFKMVWVKELRSAGIDRLNDVGIDSSGRIYFVGSYGGDLITSPEYSSPQYYPAPSGASDIIVGKFSPDGLIYDIINTGGANIDEGISMDLDAEDNIYLTGYISDDVIFSNLPTQPEGNIDSFVAKIPYKEYKNGKKIGGVYSWFGSETWSANDAKITRKEFEIPIGTTVVFNPIDSFIPGKKNHIWELKFDYTDETLINIKDAQSFIWTFNKSGFYSLYSSVEDSNGNKSVFNKEGYIRVIDHKKPSPEEIVTIVNSDTYKQRTIYRERLRPIFD
jgi:hypothetical protein